jgi:hypothetical protein
VLRADKELLLFPIVSSISLVIVSVLFFVPIILGGVLDALVLENIGIFSIIPLFLFYVAQYCVIFFANTALVGAALIRLRGGDPTLGDGFRIAARRFLPILGYALIAATVGMILKAISERSRGLSSIVISIIGMAWNIGTYLVVPILAVEEVGPIEAIRRSVELLKKTWGEQIAGNLGLGAITGLAAFGLIFLGIGFTFVAFMLELPTFLIVGGLVILFAALVLLGLVNATLTGIYTAAVYQYAAEGQLEGFFEPELIQAAFRQRI